jgi:hypothetical protein
MGSTEDGSPVVYFKIKYYKPEFFTDSSAVAFVAAILNECIESMPNMTDKWVMLLDAEGAGFSNFKYS